MHEWANRKIIEIKQKFSSTNLKTRRVANWIKFYDKETFVSFMSSFLGNHLKLYTTIFRWVCRLLEWNMWQKAIMWEQGVSYKIIWQ